VRRRDADMAPDRQRLRDRSERELLPRPLVVLAFAPRDLDLDLLGRRRDCVAGGRNLPIRVPGDVRDRDDRPEEEEPALEDDGKEDIAIDARGDLLPAGPILEADPPPVVVVLGRAPRPTDDVQDVASYSSPLGW